MAALRCGDFQERSDLLHKKCVQLVIVIRHFTCVLLSYDLDNGIDALYLVFWQVDLQFDHSFHDL